MACCGGNGCRKISGEVEGVDAGSACSLWGCRGSEGEVLTREWVDAFNKENGILMDWDYKRLHVRIVEALPEFSDIGRWQLMVGDAWLRPVSTIKELQAQLCMVTQIFFLSMGVGE